MPTQSGPSGSSGSNETLTVGNFTLADIHPLKLTFESLHRPTAEQYELLCKEWSHLRRVSSEDGPPEDDELVIRKVMVRDRMGLEFQARTIDPCGKLSVGERDWRVHAAAIYLARARRIGIGSLIRHFEMTHLVEGYNHSSPRSSGLKAHIARAQANKERGNESFRKGYPKQAMRHYIQGFASLVPYISDPCMMGFDHARTTGLLQLEYILMLNFLRTLIVLGKEPEYSQGYARDFGAIGRLEANKTYVSYKARYTILHQLMNLDPPPMILTEKDWQTYENATKEEKVSFDWVHGYCCEQELVMLLGPDFEGQDLFEAIHHPEEEDE